MTQPLDLQAPVAFIQANTAIHTPPLVPEIRLRLATEISPIWQLTEDELDRRGLPPPYWAFAWAGGQALGRYVLDHPDIVAERKVLDVGAGSGLVAIAAAKAGAARVTACDVDPFAVAAIHLNAALNGVTVEIVAEDLIGTSGMGWDIALAGDMCYEQPLAGRLAEWLRALASRGATVLLGDPGRTYLPKQGLAPIASYAVATTRELEDTDVRNTGVWRLIAEP